MVTAAQSMAPVISRMEPVGRTLSSSPPAKAAAKSPAPEKARPRISAPPIARPPAPPVADDPNLGLEPPKAQKYTVLLGAFGKQENAINLKNRLEAAGLPVAISEFTDKNKLWYRVMSGSFEDKDSAEAYSRELRQRKLVDRPYVRPM
jgi:cell division septation protein DedD